MHFTPISQATRMGAHANIGVREYATLDGRSLLRRWLEGLDVPVRARAQAAIMHLEAGDLGASRYLGAGVWEARVNAGPGFRLYFAMVEASVILLVVGAHNRSRARDIRRAQYYLSEYLEVLGYDKAQQ
jgi:putative addiction module killer protein